MTTFASVTPGNAVSWVIDNYQNLLVAALLIVGAASILVRSLAGLVRALDSAVQILVNVFPSLKTADDDLRHVAAWLDGLSQAIDALAKSKLLNGVALNNPVAPQSPAAGPDKGSAAGRADLRLVAFLAILGALLGAGSARAAVTYQIGPTVPFALVDLDAPQNPVQVLGGAGVQVSLSDSRTQLVLLGKSFDMLDVIGMAFGSVVSNQSGAQFGSFSAALGLSTLNSMLSLIFGKRIADLEGGFTGRHGWFVGGAFSFNFGLEPTGQGTADGFPVKRGNTIYF